MTKCYQCEKPAIHPVIADEAKIPLCLDCHLKYTQLLATQNDMIERTINYLTSQMEASVGLRGILPRFPERKVVQTGDVTLNNIQIDNSTIGVINTGSIETVDAAVTSLRQSGDDKLSSALLELSQAVLSNNEVVNETKNQLIEILSLIATEATAPKEKRRVATMRILLTELSTILSGISSLGELWDRIKPILESVF